MPHLVSLRHVWAFVSFIVLLPFTASQSSGAITISVSGTDPSSCIIIGQAATLGNPVILTEMTSICPSDGSKSISWPLTSSGDGSSSGMAIYGQLTTSGNTAQAGCVYVLDQMQAMYLLGRNLQWRNNVSEAYDNTAGGVLVDPTTFQPLTCVQRTDYWPSGLELPAPGSANMDTALTLTAGAGTGSGGRATSSTPIPYTAPSSSPPTSTFEIQTTSTIPPPLPISSMSGSSLTPLSSSTSGQVSLENGPVSSSSLPSSFNFLNSSISSPSSIPVIVSVSSSTSASVSSSTSARASSSTSILTSSTMPSPSSQDTSRGPPSSFYSAKSSAMPISHSSSSEPSWPSSERSRTVSPPSISPTPRSSSSSSPDLGSSPMSNLGILSNSGALPRLGSMSASPSSHIIPPITSQLVASHSSTNPQTSFSRQISAGKGGPSVSSVTQGEGGGFEQSSYSPQTSSTQHKRSSSNVRSTSSSRAKSTTTVFTTTTDTITVTVWPSSSSNPSSPKTSQSSEGEGLYESHPSASSWMDQPHSSATDSRPAQHSTASPSSTRETTSDGCNDCDRPPASSSFPSNAPSTSPSPSPSPPPPAPPAPPSPSPQPSPPPPSSSAAPAPPPPPQPPATSATTPPATGGIGPVFTVGGSTVGAFSLDTPPVFSGVIVTKEVVHNTKPVSDDLKPSSTAMSEANPMGGSGGKTIDKGLELRAENSEGTADTAEELLTALDDGFEASSGYTNSLPPRELVLVEENERALSSQVKGSHPQRRCWKSRITVRDSMVCDEAALV